jgi:hypothetical protein
MGARDPRFQVERRKNKNMIPSKKSALALLAGLAFLMTACSHLQTTSTSGGGTGSGTYTVSGSISGLAGTGLQLVDTINGTTIDTLTVTTGATNFTFAISVPSGETYAVTVKTQPTNPGQNCTVTSGSGSASTANITNVAIACTTLPVTATIGGTVSGLLGTGLILQDNGGDSLTITQNGSFTFKTPVTGPTDAYAVTVLTQPTGPLQICTVTNGSGTATANVTNVSVTCVLAYTIGGNVTGLTGTGLILQNSGAEQLPITANGAFTFKNPVPTGFAYTVSIYAQPTGPVQTCVITPSTATGTATANVTNVTVNCPAVTYSVGGTVVGLEGVLPNNGQLTDSSFTLENVLGNTLVIPANGPFTFATPEALNDQYEVSVFTLPSTQSQYCTLWNYKGVVTANITTIIVDCAHNDWTWIDGTNVAGTVAAPQYGSFPQSPPTTVPNPYTNTPGARYGGAGWTDNNGNMWLFGGEGWELSGNPSPATVDDQMNDLWACVLPVPGSDQCQWQLVGAYNATSGAGIILNAQNEGQLGVYTGTSIVPGGRYGAATWTDAGGNLWMFGGYGLSAGARGLLNDMWELDTSSYTTVSSFTNNPGSWTWESSSNAITKDVNQPGIYSPAGSAYPGARVNAVSWKDSSGNFWMFGGYGFDGSGNEGYLSDLWEYTGGKWVFVTGSNLANQNGVYGTQGTPSTNNAPGGRHEAVGWADASGNLWLFGGEGEDSVGTSDGILNDLWVYNIVGNTWTYVMGSETANQTGVYGLEPLVGPPSTTGAAGTYGLTNTTAGTLPGSRWGASGWVDNGGNFWLFGGWGLDSSATNGNGALNDFWVYTPNTTAGQPGTWTWIKGSNTGSENGIYGNETRPYQTYEIWTPGGRSNPTHWKDNLGQLWLFGGEGYDATSTTGNGYLNDMWRYLPYPD